MSGSDRWKVLSIELTEPLPELRREPGYDGLYVIFFSSGVPLGHYRLSSEQLPMAPRHLANCAAWAIAQSVGDYLLEEGFRSALPGLPEPAIAEPEQALAQLLKLERPMEQLGAGPFGCASAAPRGISVAVCTRELPR